MEISKIGEFGLISRIDDGCVNDPSSVVQGIGDDAAVVRVSPGCMLLICTDMLVEDVHFIRCAVPWTHIGYKAVAVNLSDIAAMGGEPKHCVVSIALPPSERVENVDRLYEGMKCLLAKDRVNLVGGDMVESSILAISVTMVGQADEKKIKYRYGARPGDVVMVTGDLGASAAGLHLLEAELKSGTWTINSAPDMEEQPHQEDPRSTALRAHFLPVPRLEESRTLVGLGPGCVTAMIDVSDGLASEVGHICDRSGTGALIYSDLVPVSESARMIADEAGIDPLEWALFGGEDFELLFTVSKGYVRDVEDAFEAAGLCRVTAIGEITEPSLRRSIVIAGGERVDLARDGYVHFRQAFR